MFSRVCAYALQGAIHRAVFGIRGFVDTVFSVQDAFFDKKRSSSQDLS